MQVIEYVLPGNSYFQIKEWFTKLMNEGHMNLCAWTLATCLDWLNNNFDNHTLQIKDHWLNSEYMIIREQAELIDLKNKSMENSQQVNDELMELEKVSILKNTDLFSETPENLLVDLASLVKTVRLSKGDVLFRENDPGDAMFIIHSGKIEIRDAEKKLVEFRELDFFGELSLLDNESRSAAAIALEESLLLSISQDDFYELISFRTEVAKSVLKVLSQRLRKQNKS